MNNTIALTLIAAAHVLTAAAGDRMALWPEGRVPDFQAHQVGAMENETKAKGFVADEHRMPYLQWYAAPTNANGACMILLSGGAYSYCCSISLVEAWRKELTALGFQCVNLAYRTPRPKGLPIWQSAWEDGQRAVRLVRSEARRRGFDPERIGVMGMSAGGHLATLLATSALTPAYARVDALDDIPCHVNLAIPHAAAYNTATNIETGAAFDPAAAGAVNSCFKFDAKTCPICFNHGGTDPYTPLGSTLCYRELRKRKVPAELHLYADRGHAAHESGRFVEFMRQLGWLGELGFQWPLDHRYHPDATARTEKEALWPTNGIPSRQADQPYEPYLVWYVPEKRTTRAIQVVFAGGGYTDCNYVGEAEPVAYYLNQKGMTTVCVKYRCPRPKDAPKHLLAWQDAQRAIRKVRSEASARGLDPNRIGAMGFSAGGHLTLMTALSSLTNAYEPVDDVDRMPCSVQWACPVYPAYALTDGVDSPNTEGGNLDRDVPVPEFAFDAATPPMCFLHGDADGYSAMASVKIWERLRAMGVQGDLHTLALQGHCFQLRAAEGTGAFTCLDRVWEFLVRKGFLRENAADGFPGRGVIAHRGDAAEYPENTPEAFRSAVAKGAAMVELDEWRCKTGELVVCHDGSVDRTTDGKGRICDLTLEQIRALDAGCRKSSRFRGTRIPTLAEALACFPKTGLLLNIHCKTGDAAPEVAELLRREGRIRQGILMCDSREALEAVRAKCPWARTGLVGDTEDGWQKRPWTDAEAWETIRYAAKVGVDFLQVLPGCHCTVEQMRFLHDRGIRTTYFMADDARTMRELVAEGHDFIFTDSYSELEPVYRQAVAK